MKFCSDCGEPVRFAIPPGDDRPRHVCDACTTVHYQNPRVITGCIPVHGDRILLCRRAIEPRRGFRTLPAGFLEQGETTAEGAMRECLEEANARVSLDGLYGVYDILHIGQVYLFYRATLADLDFHPGDESLETALFREEEIPWDDLAFRVVTLALRQFFADRREGSFALRHGAIDSPRP
ncbi:MAG: NUDIX hydrolase [Porticoccaceae bacterium]|jgi:ADP-ribose pyrophosphatase YjhB (NUDIX family)|nr:NUDIX hydrolase [Porticoccaceae bacterium]HLS98299.1 NUDIX hydrolase [Porticoccaceae bacterium]